VPQSAEPNIEAIDVLYNDRREPCPQSRPIFVSHFAGEKRPRLVRLRWKRTRIRDDPAEVAGRESSPESPLRSNSDADDPS